MPLTFISGLVADMCHGVSQPWLLIFIVVAGFCIWPVLLSDGLWLFKFSNHLSEAGIACCLAIYVAWMSVLYVYFSWYRGFICSL